MDKKIMIDSQIKNLQQDVVELQTLREEVFPSSFELTLEVNSEEMSETLQQDSQEGNTVEELKYVHDKLQVEIQTFGRILDVFRGKNFFKPPEYTFNHPLQQINDDQMTSIESSSSTVILEGMEEDCLNEVEFIQDHNGDFREELHEITLDVVHDEDELGYTCNDCGMVFPTTDILEIHSKIHIVPLPVKTVKNLTCSICDKTFKTTRSLIRHGIVHTKERPYRCSFCGKGCQSIEHAKVHERIHTGEKPYSCETCGKDFRTSNALTAHIKSTHVEGHEFVCDVCGKGYNVKSLFITHKRVHTGEKPFTCKICGKSYRDPQYLKKHMKFHSDIKPFKCDICGKAFFMKQYLQVHKRFHTGERPYSCDICGKGFVTPTHARKHLKTHENDKQFRCEVCGRGFDDEAQFTRHTAIHAIEEKAFPCEYCSKSYTHKNSLVHHMKSHDGQNIPVAVKVEQ